MSKFSKIMSDITLLSLKVALAFSVSYLIYVIISGPVDKNSKILVDPTNGKVYVVEHEGLNEYQIWEIVTPDSLKNWVPNVKSQVNNTNN
jgi:hypothetical protein